MKEIKFPLLTKDDIELRIGQMSKDNKKASLLLYQDARCGMKYLDKVLGATNWQKRYYEVRGLVICSLGININYDEPNKEPYWIWKDDTGSSGAIEEEKSIVSDSFKRCCVVVGLSRELYSSPQVWVEVSSKYDKFYVKEIGYNENREINKLVITDAKGKEVYSYGVKGNQASKEPKTTKETDLDNKQNVSMKEISASVKSMDDYVNEYHDPLSDNSDMAYIKEYYNSLEESRKERFSIWLFTTVQETNIDKLNESKAKIVADLLRKQVAKDLEKKASDK